MMLVRGLVLGMPMTVVEPAADPLAALPTDVAFEFAAFVPLQLQTLLDLALVASSDSCFPEDTARSFRIRRILEGMKAILVGGAAISTTLAAQIRQLRAPVYHTYGMTETVTHIALKRLNGPAESQAFVVLPGITIGVDERDCLYIEGPMTAGARVQTNDLVELRGSHEFVWLGRIDNVINSGGVKVQVEVVEEAVEQLAAQQPELGLAGRRLFVGGVPDPRLGEAVTLIVEGAPLTADAEEQLRWSLSQVLPRYHAPRQVRYVARFTETPTGKIDRRSTLQETTN
jgi:O-succinylbenzoic acid--CoA ligase